MKKKAAPSLDHPKCGPAAETSVATEGRTRKGACHPDQTTGAPDPKGTAGKAAAGAEVTGKAPGEKAEKVTAIWVHQWEGPVDEKQMHKALLRTVRRQIKALGLSDAALAVLTGLNRSYIYKIRTMIKMPTLNLILRWFTSRKVNSGYIISVHEKALRLQCLG